MALSSSPRKVIPLSGGDGWEPHSRQRSASSGPSVTRRAFFCGVVVEGPRDGEDLSEDVQELVTSLGDRLLADVGQELEEVNLSSSRDASHSGTGSEQKPSSETNVLSDLIEELVTTERSYVNRLRTLKQSYADPLRSYARSKDTAIISPYDANTMFGNIDNIIPVNEAFLQDLENMLAMKGRGSLGVGDVALHHFKQLRNFECYRQYYSKREEAQAIYKREMAKKSTTGFASFVERIKYSTSDYKNRVGLRELLMEPVQRIPRYTLLFRSMVKHMYHGDPQRTKILEANEIASKIALAEADDQTKHAATMYCLGASIEGFPHGLISSRRRFIDCIDVEDVLVDASPSLSSAASINSTASGIGALHCTLFLFDDKLMIVKRQNGEKSGRSLAGLDDVEKFTNGSGFPKGIMKKGGLSFKGVVDITDVVATDVSGPDIHLYLENPPQGQSDRWAGRSFRVLSVVHPPAPVNQNPIRTDQDKQRFLEHLWNAQARFRAKLGQSVVLQSDETEVESRSGKTTFAHTYYNVYQRTSFLKEPKKTKVVVHIDASGSADPIPCTYDVPPFVVIRVQPMPGELCRYTVTTNILDEDEEVDIVKTANVPSRITNTIHQFGLFKFKTDVVSRPATPTASTRSRAHIFGLDVISRNLFNSRSGSSKSDIFGNGSIGSHRRSKSTASRSSAYTDTTMTASDSFMKFSQRSISTAATSIMDEDSFFGRSVSKSKKLVRRGKSPGPVLDLDSSGDSEHLVRRRARSMSAPREREPEYSDGEEYTDIDLNLQDVSQSDLDLKRQLDLARRNSRNQHGNRIPVPPMEKPVEDTIYEDEPPLPLRPASRAGSSFIDKEGSSLGSTTPPDHRSITPSSDSPRKGRPTSRSSADRRPLGPRAPSPLPPMETLAESPSLDIESALETTLVNMGHYPKPQTPSRRTAPGSGQPSVASPIPRTRRLPLETVENNAELTPRTVGGGKKPQTEVEPLSIIKKRTPAVTSAPLSPTPMRKTYAKNSPLARVSPSPRAHRVPSGDLQRPQIPVKVNGQSREQAIENCSALFKSNQEHLESAQRTLKRMRTELGSMPTKKSYETEDGPNILSPGRVTPRTPQRTALTKEAQQRQEEMRQLIGRRNGDGPLTPRGRPRSMVSQFEHLPQEIAQGNDDIFGWLKNVDTLISDAEGHVSCALDNGGDLEHDVDGLVSQLNESQALHERAKTELQSTKRQCELVKNLLSDATKENEIMYEAFNEELDGMFNDVNLPEEAAWNAMTRDLRKAKEERNSLTRENSQLKRKLQEAESQRDEWATLLRTHGLIP